MGLKKGDDRRVDELENTIDMAVRTVSGLTTIIHEMNRGWHDIREEMGETRKHAKTHRELLNLINDLRDDLAAYKCDVDQIRTQNELIIARMKKIEKHLGYDWDDMDDGCY